MSARAAAYQSQITGQTGMAYFVNGVKFDGYTAGEGLLDAKGPGFAWAVRDGEFIEGFQGAQKFVDQAARQIAASGGMPITWHVAEPETAIAIQNLLSKNAIETIAIVNTLPIP